MATAKQIAARKKFAERARSGELAKMRKKSTRKNNPTANKEYSKLELVRSVADQITAYAKARGGMDKNDFMKAAKILKKGDLRAAINFAETLDSDPRDYLLSMIDGLRQNNPTATRAASRKANPSSKNLVFGALEFKVSKWNRAKNTASGNPVYDFELINRFNGRVYSGKTKPNASFVYQYGNQIGEGDLIIATLEKTPSGRVYMTDIKEKRQVNPTATRAPARPRTKLISNGERKKNPATKDFFYVNVIDDGGFQFGMDDRTPVLFKFSNREMKRGVYRSFALPFNVTSNPEFQNFVKSLPGNQIVISLKDLRKNLSAYA